MKRVLHATQGKRVEIGRRMQQAREAAGMTQQALARELSVNQSVVAKMETGALAARLNDYFTFSAAVNVDPCDIAHDVFESGEQLRLIVPPYLLLEEYIMLSRLLELDTYKNLETLAALHSDLELAAGPQRVIRPKPVRLRQVRNAFLQMKLG